VSLSQRIALALVKPLFKTLISWEVKGGENVPLTGPLIVVANHVHLVDPVLLALSFPRWINFMAKEQLFRYPVLRLIIRWSQAFSVSHQGTIKDKRKALEQAKDILNRGLVLGVFPEGHRSREAKLLDGKPGAAVIASRMDIPLLPVGIIGTGELKGISWLWRRPHILINIGRPFKFPSVDGRLTRPQTKSLAETMMHKIAILLPPENRGIYGD
jgi:1-acyl-sn-glycerol-3-phosphate acyltransferase